MHRKYVYLNMNARNIRRILPTHFDIKNIKYKYFIYITHLFIKFLLSLC